MTSMVLFTVLQAVHMACMVLFTVAGCPQDLYGPVQCVCAAGCPHDLYGPVHSVAGCPHGLYGPVHCVAGCPHGLYGPACSLRCSGNCLDSVSCDADKGHCPEGLCSAGWHGPNCDKREPHSDTQPLFRTSRPNRKA